MFGNCFFFPSILLYMCFLALFSAEARNSVFSDFFFNSSYPFYSLFFASFFKSDELIKAVQYDLMYYCTCVCMCFWGKREREGKEGFGVWMSWHGMGFFFGGRHGIHLGCVDALMYRLDGHVNYCKTNSSLSSARMT